MNIVKLLFIIYLIVMLVACARAGDKLRGPHPRNVRPVTLEEDTGTFIAAVLTTALFAYLIFGHPAI